MNKWGFIIFRIINPRTGFLLHLTNLEIRLDDLENYEYPLSITIPGNTKRTQMIEHEVKMLKAIWLFFGR